MSSRWRVAFTLFTLVFCDIALAQKIAPESAITRYKKMTAVAPKKCSENDKADEIVVCGEDPHRYRLPFPADREPRDGARRATGEIVSSTIDGGPPAPCPIRGCSGGGSIIDATAKILSAIIDPDD